MTFSLNRTALAKELALLSLATERKQLIPTLATVMIGVVGDEVTLTTTDLHVTVTTSIPASGDTWGGCLPCRQLYELTRLFGDEEVIQFTEKPNNRMEVRWGKSRHLLPITPIAEYPEIDHASGKPFTLPLPQLTAAISATSFAMLEPRDETSPKDVIFTGLSLVAADGVLTVAASRKSITAAVEMLVDASFAIILPRGAVAAIGRLEGENVAIRVDGSHAEFTAGNRSITCRLLMGKFPNWRMFVPEYPYRAEVNTEALSAALRRAQVTMDRANPSGFESMKATVTADQLLVETRGGDSGQSLEPVAITSNLNGEPFTVGFFAHQMLSVLAKCEESVMCEMATASSPIAFTSEAARYFIMPVRLKF